MWYHVVVGHMFGCGATWSGSLVGHCCMDPCHGHYIHGHLLGGETTRSTTAVWWKDISHSSHLPSCLNVWIPLGNWGFVSIFARFEQCASVGEDLSCGLQASVEFTLKRSSKVAGNHDCLNLSELCHQATPSGVEVRIRCEKHSRQSSFSLFFFRLRVISAMFSKLRRSFWGLQVQQTVGKQIERWCQSKPSKALCDHRPSHSLEIQESFQFTP